MLIYIKHACHICSKEFKSSYNLRRHISNIHNKAMPSKEADGNYESSLNGEIIANENTPDSIPHFACPSCWQIYPHFQQIKEHMLNHETQRDTPSVLINTKKGAFVFRDASTALHPPKRPKITSENISRLSPVATIINPYNEHLLPEQKRLARQQIVDQANMESLKQYPTAYNMLKQALDVELSKLPPFLWSFAQPSDIAADDAAMMKIIQFVLTDFCSKCHRYAYYQSKYERTYWIDRVVPILQCFGDHSQLLGFEWCEIPTNEHAEFTTNPQSWMRTDTVKYHDGLGYDMHGNCRLVIEGSSRDANKEDLEHTQDDTVKALYSCIEILSLFVRRHAAASFSSLCSVFSYSLQCVCTTITLSTTKMDRENIGKYVQTEVRHAEIPSNFNDRVSWMGVFELVAFLFLSLREQETTIQTIKKENSGIVLVEDADRAFNILNETNGQQDI